MPKTTNGAIPATISRTALIERAGANVPPERVIFDRNVFDGTAGHLNTPLESVDAYRDAIVSTFEEVQRVETYAGFTLDELAVALDVVLNSMEDGIPQIVKVRPGESPRSRRVEIGFDHKTGKMRYRVVPGGPMSLPGFRDLSKKKPAWIEVGWDGSAPYLNAYTIRGDQGRLEGIFGFVRDYAQANSIYLGQAIDTDFKFINLSKFKPENVALTDSARVAVDLYVRQQFTNAARLDLHNQSPKTGIMFQGPPGGGKTLIVSLCEYISVMSGGTVIHVDPALGLNGLAAADIMARRLLEAGHTVLISFEDMEKLADQSREKVLEILDGAGAKLTRRIIVGTTNFIEQIDRAMLRPGRFDAIIECGLPDLSAFTQLINVLIPEHQRVEIDYEQAFEFFEGYSYATIANAVSVVIRSAIAHSESDEILVHTQDLINAALMVKYHHDLLQEPVEAKQPQLAQAFLDTFDERFKTVINNVKKFGMLDRTDYDRIHDIVGEQADNVIEGRIDGARVDLKTGTIGTNG